MSRLLLYTRSISLSDNSTTLTGSNIIANIKVINLLFFGVKFESNTPKLINIIWNNIKFAIEEFFRKLINLLPITSSELDQCPEFRNKYTFKSMYCKSICHTCNVITYNSFDAFALF